MSVNVNSVTDSYNAWYDYKYGGNTRGITQEEITQIETRWKGNLKSWKAQAVKDENEYRITDEEFADSKSTGKQNAQDTTGCSGKKGGMIARGAVDGVLGAAGAAAMGTKIGSQIANKAGSAIVKQVGGNRHEVFVRGRAAFVVAAPLSLAVGTAYRTNKPNEEEHNAANQLREELLPNAQADLGDANYDMEKAAEKSADLTDEGNAYNEKRQGEIDEKQALFEQYRASYLELQEKVASGQKLTDSEKALYEQLKPTMEELGEEITVIQEETSEDVNDIRDEIAEYESDFDSAADTIAQVQGLTDYAEGFDETAQTMCYVEAGAQTLNAYSGLKAAAQATKVAAAPLGAGLWAIPFIGMGAAGAFMSGLGTIEQYEWAKDIGAEIDVRDNTQGFGSKTLKTYDDRVKIYDDNVDIVENLELAMPDDLVIPEDTIGENGDEPIVIGSAGTNDDDKNDKLKKDEKDRSA